jgi:hypothetical protein
MDMFQIGFTVEGGKREMAIHHITNGGDVSKTHGGAGSLRW